MKRSEFDAWEDRIRARAERLWEEAGRPDGSRDTYLEEARELIAIEEVPAATLDPVEAAEPVIEEASIQRNLGEFPTLTDQGDEQTYPDDPEDGIRLSDEDASDTGGVLPGDDQPNEDMPDVSVADADIASTAFDSDAEDAPPADDINEDGLPDQPGLDGEDGEDLEDKAGVTVFGR